MDNTIIFGNGINRLSAKNISWGHLLDVIKGSRKFNDDLLPNTMIYERIILERPDTHDDVLYNEFEVKKEISELMKTVKAKSSKFINDNKLVGNRFEWQRGYSAFSYSQSQIDQVYRYVSNQEEHHKMVDFKTEHRDLLIKNLIEYDEKYFFEDLI